MKIYDITQEVFGCKVYPGDMAPVKIENMRMSCGDLYNLTSFEMCAHNGTHVDAPFHFLADGYGVEQIPLEKTVGYCYVFRQDTDMSGGQAQAILDTAKQAHPESAKRILIKGEGIVTPEAARVFAAAGIDLIGVEGQSVGPQNAPMEVHKILLGVNMVLLEGIRLTAVEEGVYFLNAAPLPLGGSDGAPCRAILMKA